MAATAAMIQDRSLAFGGGAKKAGARRGRPGAGAAEWAVRRVGLWKRRRLRKRWRRDAGGMANPGPVR